MDVHPTPVFETVAVGLIALVLWHLRDRFRPGVLFALYLVLTGIERLLIEFIRRNDAVLAGLTTAQLFSLVMVAGGAAISSTAGSTRRLRARLRAGGSAPTAAAAHSASATEAPAALPKWCEAYMPTTPATAPTTAPSTSPRAGSRA